MGDGGADSTGPKIRQCMYQFDWQMNQLINQSVNRSILTEGDCVDPQIIWAREAVCHYILFQFPDTMISFTQLLTLLRTNFIIRPASTFFSAVLRTDSLWILRFREQRNIVCVRLHAFFMCSQELGYFYNRSAALYTGRIQFRMYFSKKYIFTTHKSSWHEKKASYFWCPLTFWNSGKFK